MKALATGISVRFVLPIALVLATIAAKKTIPEGVPRKCVMPGDPALRRHTLRNELVVDATRPDSVGSSDRLKVAV